MKVSVDKRLKPFVGIWFSGFYWQNVAIAFLVVSSFINDSIFFIENANPISFLFFYLQFVCVSR